MDRDMVEIYQIAPRNVKNVKVNRWTDRPTIDGQVIRNLP